MELKRHKQYIVEWGSISSEVISASRRLSKMIWKHSFDKMTYYSWDEKKPYIEGEFEFDFSSVGFDIDIPFTVTYTIYITNTKEEYDNLFSNVNGDESANSSTDFENHRINIVSGMIGGYPSPDFLSNVMHEVDHVFEYMKGFKKNTTLYDRVINGINSDDTYVKTVATLMYYCFKHEQDAFVHGFYGALCQNKYDGDFKAALYGLSEYYNLSKIKLIVQHEYNREEIKAACSKLGTSYEHVIRFATYIAKRMENKLFKAYMRYCIQKSKITAEGIIQKNKMNPFIFNEYKKIYKNLALKEEKYIDKP